MLIGLSFIKGKTLDSQVQVIVFLFICGKTLVLQIQGIGLLFISGMTLDLQVQVIVILFMWQYPCFTIPGFFGLSFICGKTLVYKSMVLCSCLYMMRPLFHKARFSLVCH